MSKIIIGILVVFGILTVLFIWGLGESGKECRQRFGADFNLEVDGSYMRCVNAKGEVREL